MPPPPSWAPRGRRCAKPSDATAWACPPPNPEAVRQRAIAVARQRNGRPAAPGLDPVFVALNLASSRPENGRRPSCTSGSGARSSTPSWARMWWSSCTAKVTPAGQPPGPGRSSDGPSAATGWPANAPAASSTAALTAPTASAGPSNARSGRRRPMLADRPVPDGHMSKGEHSGSGPICSRPRPAHRSARVQNFLNLGPLPVRSRCRMVEPSDVVGG
jgi:hypothetical protein